MHGVARCSPTPAALVRIVSATLIVTMMPVTVQPLQGIAQA